MGLLPLHTPGSGTAGEGIAGGEKGAWETPCGPAPGAPGTSMGAVGRDAAGAGVMAGGEAITALGVAGIPPGEAAVGVEEVTVVCWVGVLASTLFFGALGS